VTRRPPSIREEIQQTKAFPSVAEEASVSLLRTTDLVRRRLAAIVEPHGITLQQYNVLRILRGAGEKGLPTLEIAARMVEQAPGITRLIDRLEAKRWVERERSTGDRRCVYCRITRAGLLLLAGLDAPIADADAHLASCLPQPQIRQLVDLLARLRMAGAETSGIAKKTRRR
jgi:MarR family transcriptional regulator, organic hydroperoxide resistance regulator